MKVRKKDNEALENAKRQAKEFPSPFIDYKKKGCQVELMGEEAIDCINCFKLNA